MKRSLAVAALALLAAGCGSSYGKAGGAAPSPSIAPSPYVVGTSGGEESVTVHLGDRIRLVVPAGATISENGASRMADEGHGVFHAVGIGTASIEVVQSPPCPSGQAACSHLLRLLSVVEVTVKK